MLSHLAQSGSLPYPKPHSSEWRELGLGRRRPGSSHARQAVLAPRGLAAITTQHLLSTKAATAPQAPRVHFTQREPRLGRDGAVTVMCPQKRQRWDPNTEPSSRCHQGWRNRKQGPEQSSHPGCPARRASVSTLPSAQQRGRPGPLPRRGHRGGAGTSQSSPPQRL